MHSYYFLNIISNYRIITIPIIEKYKFLKTIPNTLHIKYQVDCCLINMKIVNPIIFCSYFFVPWNRSAIMHQVKLLHLFRVYFLFFFRITGYFFPGKCYKATFFVLGNKDLSFLFVTYLNLGLRFSTSSKKLHHDNTFYT